jgi:DNA helicase-2/ATP-dependent DNA helicase PcrA
MMTEPALAAAVCARFDHVLVDEYQDTNALQAAILLGLTPDGCGLTVVGDDAQSIFSFRAATVRNILEFPTQFDPPAHIVTLEQNYRSSVPILDACNAVIGLSRERFVKNLFSTKLSQQKPILLTAEDEAGQVEYVVERILEHREAGIDLRRQAVLFRAAHHSDQLEVDLARRNIPFVKYGGLKFLEAAHVKDVLCILRWAENAHDSIAAFRVLQLLPGMGPGNARRAVAHLEQHHFNVAALPGFRAPAAAAEDWPGLCTLLLRLHNPATVWQGQLGAVRQWYQPHLERLYDAAPARAGDLEQLEQIATAYPSRERFLTELTLDPPSATGDEAGVPHLDEDYLILSTIHSAKGQEWDVVYVLNAVDGCIPSDMATDSPEHIEEERRLLYVAMTRARDHLYLMHPLRFFTREQHRHGDRHIYAPRTRFIPDSILGHFERRTHARHHAGDPSAPNRVRVDVGARLRAMWS